MKKPCFLILISALALSFHTAEARPEKPDVNDLPLHEQPVQLPNYDQFRRMTEDKQMAYLHDVQEMLVEVSATGVQVSSLFDYVQPTSSWATFFGMIRNASADDCTGRNFWVLSTGDLCTGSSALPTCGPQAAAMATTCKTEYNNSMMRLQDRLTKKAETGADTEKQRIQQSQQMDQAAQQVREASDAKAAAANANPTGGGAATAAKPSFIKEPFSSKSDADTNQDKKAKKYRCIYAGFTIYGNDCKPQDKYIDPKTNSVYTCAPTDGDKDYGVITPSKADPKKTVLCNPVFFGTVPGPSSNASLAKPEPICVAKGKNATADCLKAVSGDKKAGSLKSAVKFAKDDKAKYQELTDTLTSLCSGETSSATSGMSASSKKDLDSTCKKYRERMFDYQSAYGQGGFNSYGMPGAK